jgi:hypothetical protein
MTQKTSTSRGRSSRLSLASRLLGGALRANLPETPLNEPWRNKKRLGKNRGRRKK